MADDVNPALREELEAAMAVLQPEIRGLHDLTTVSISSDLIAEIARQITAREHRRDLVQATIDTLDDVLTARKALEADGYPALPNAIISPSLLSELKEETADITAAVGVFEGKSPATSMSIGLGAPVDKPPA